MRSLLDKLFSFTGGATRSEYLRVGVSLLAIKYAVDALVYYLVLGRWWHPIDYLNPIYSQRMSGAPDWEGLPPAYVVFLLLWGLCFAWIGTIWSARRAVDAGHSPWWGLFFFVPYFNYALILELVLWPSAKAGAVPPRRAGVESNSQHRMSVVVLTGLAFLALMAVLYGLMVEQTENYGVAAFVSLPLVFGLGIGYLVHKPHVRSVGYTLRFSFMSTLVACLALVLFALEGLICVAMAFPIVFVATFTGAMIGRALIASGASRPTAPMCLVIALPFSAWIDSEVAHPPAREVMSSVEIDAPIETVWEHVVAFSELPEPTSWLFKTGLAYPMRARVEGRGVGAVRYCEFSTGPFVEPITVWDEPHRLGFDVIEQPVPMEEWSFYADVHPPHLLTTFRSVRGEFRLTSLAGGRTLLEGSTWYELDMAPEAYWRLWGDTIIHRIHGRVLRHVKSLSEAPHAD